jgi:hypothetical protein
MSNVPSGLDRDELWKALVETVHALIMYKNHKRYVEGVMLKEKPDISAKELALQLNISLGESLVILSELHGDTGKAPSKTDGKSDDRTLLEFTA